MKKRIANLLVITVLLLIPILFTGCKKSEVFRGGEGTDYPFTYSVSSKGEVTVTLDGSKTPDYYWATEIDNENVVNVKAKGSEKNGNAKFVITPFQEGSVGVTFVRMKDTENVFGTENVSEIPENFDVSETGDYDPLPEMESEVLEENVVPLPETDYSEDELRKPKDQVCRIALHIETRNAEKKFYTEVFVMTTDEMQSSENGSDSDSGITYQFWSDDFGVIRINLTNVDGGWFVLSKDHYTGKVEEILDESGELIGYAGTQAPVDDLGNPIIVDVYPYGGVGYECYEIDPIAPGYGTITFSAPKEGKQVVINYEISELNELTITSHKIQDYTPAKEELKELDDKGDEGDNFLRDDPSMNIDPDTYVEDESDTEAVEGDDNADGKEEKASE